MADISLKVRADALGKSLENLAPMVEAEINEAVRNLAHATYTAITAKVQSMSMSAGSRQDYLKALQFHDLGNDAYLIVLDGDWANKLEKGYGAYSIRDVLLKSEKIVGVGSRAGESWVRKAKDGHKYAAVPFEHKPHAANTGDLAADIKKMMGQGVNGLQQKITKTFANADGVPLSGKVATSIPGDTSVPKNLQGLTKYQSVSPKGKVSSVYMTYRMVSENGKDWVHPGSPGFQLFKEAEVYVEQQLDNIIKTLLK